MKHIRCASLVYLAGMSFRGNSNRALQRAHVLPLSLSEKIVSLPKILFPYFCFQTFTPG